MAILGKSVLIVLGAIALTIGAYLAYAMLVANPRDVQQIRTNPDGALAARVMLLGLPSGEELPVNYLQEGETVFVGADGRWWREFLPDGAPVTMLIRGQTLSGYARVVLDNPEYTHEVFSRLRPTAPAWLPDALNGKLIVITITASG